MLITSQSNRQSCEICGERPPDRFARNQEAREAGFRYARTRQNRRRLPGDIPRMPDVWQVRLAAAGMTTWAGRLACGSCVRLFWRTATGE